MTPAKSLGLVLIVSALAGCGTSDNRRGGASALDEPLPSGGRFAPRAGSGTPLKMTAPETRDMKLKRLEAQKYRTAANQATGSERERYLQLAESLEQQIAAEQAKW